MRLRAPKPGEAAALSALCLRSKAHWGYSAAFMAACAAELTLSEAGLTQLPLQVAERDGVPAGLAQLEFDGPDAWLDKLFVDPAHMGNGLGAALFGWAVDAARGKARRMIIQADPGAVGFYERMGAERTGQAPSASIPGRVLPVLAFSLRPAD